MPQHVRMYRELHLGPSSARASPASARNCRDCRRAHEVGAARRWPERPARQPRPFEAGQPNRTRGRGDRITELQLENSRLRRLVTDLLLEKVKLEEAAQVNVPSREGTKRAFR